MKKFGNIEVAWVLDEIAALLEIKGEDIFKIRAYQRAARAIENLDVDITDLFRQKKLNGISGVGKNIAAKLEELLSTGRLIYLEKLRGEIPPGLVEMMNVPGVGPKMARTFYEKLGISSLKELEDAARGKKIRSLPGMGSKTELNILRGIEMLKSGGRGRITLGLAWTVADSLLNFLRSLPWVVDAETAGSTRRMKEAIGDIDIVVGTEEPEKVAEVFIKHPQVKEVLAHGSTKISVLLKFGVQVDLRLVRPDEFWTALHHFTGSKEHNVRLRERAHKIGIKINEYGLFKIDSDERIPVSGEEDIYTALGLAYIPPELREDRGEVFAAEEGRLPQVIGYDDMKGDLHLHSNWSDGVNSIEQIVEQAKKMGYEYIAITDHSRSLGIARGLSTERLTEQQEVINALQKEEAIHILTGVEADILANGDMDYPDEILAEKDIVIGSIHSGFRQDKEKITERIISAIKNEHVDIIAHPTGRLIGRRDPYEVDMDRIFEMAAKYNTVLEINSSPDRLDLNDLYVRQAKEMGIKIAINTDAHEIIRMHEIRYGIGTARRGWLEKEDVINTWDYDKLRRFLKNR
ncbi:DNA polymerase/3'-5' exonuclease PolX [Thermincola ferriacetica]